MISVVGTNHRHASLATRERLAAGNPEADALLHAARTQRGTREGVFLSTCNRIEVYLEGPGHEADAVGMLLLARPECQLSEGEGTLYQYRGAAAAAHLFRVASGLDSLVLGEREIAAQVKAALAAATEGGHAGPVLSRLFRHALRTGKRARTETAISSGLFSAGQCAARLAEQVLGTLQGRPLLVFGAGRIAHVAAKHICALGAGPLLVFSRTPDRAQALAHSLDGAAVDGLGLMDALRQCDIIVGCAAAPHHVVGKRELGAAMAARESRPLVVVDLGVPRNVDPEVAAIPGVHLFNLDDLEGVVAENREARAAEIARVEAIVTEEVAAFTRWQAEREAAAVIARLCEKAEQIRQECLRQTHADDANGGGPDAAYLTDLLVRKLLHQPLTALRRACADGEDLTAAAERLFGLAPAEEVGDRE